MISRRRFVCVTATAALAAPFPALPQKSGRIPILAIVGNSAPSELAAPPSETMRVLLHRLRELGWEDGRTLRIERHTAEGKLERAQAVFADLAARKVDVIHTQGNVGAHLMPEVAQRATRTIPIVFIGGGVDPVGQGLVASLARPGGNLTGLTVSLGIDFSLKRLELLKEIVPGIKRVAVLGPRGSDFEANIERLRGGLARLGLSPILAPADKEDDYEQEFETAVRERADGVFVVNVSLNLRHRSRIAALAARHRLPAMYFFRESVEAGGLAAYGVDLLDLNRRSAGYVDRILRGAKPGDLPVELPTKFELSINLKTAKALGLKVPQSILLRADRVIE